MTRSSDKLFAGYIPKLYETYMVPMLFEPYAVDLAKRLASRSLERVLEIAAGTGVVTRALAATLPRDTAIVATDLNQPMLDHAAAIGTAGPVEWRQADAMQLPFPDQTFDAVVCQFGVMFLPDKAKAFAEARRVLRPGGVLVFNTWDRIEENEFANTVTDALATVFPGDPPRFMARVPHGYHDPAIAASDLTSGGFISRPEIVTLAKRSRANSARDVAIAICQGTPVRNEIEARDASRLEEATDEAAEGIARRFGRGEVDGKMQAFVVTVVR
jgi:SAM-dependent methyltransferase